MYSMNFNEHFLFVKITSLIMFGLHAFLTSILRQQSFWNYGHDEMRGDSSQDLRNCNTLFYPKRFYRKIISTNAWKMLDKI